MNVRNVALTIAGEISKGRGQFELDNRTYAYARIAVENVSESERRNSHIPSFLVFVANGATPPSHADPAIASMSNSAKYHRPSNKSRKRKTHNPSMKCQ